MNTHKNSFPQLSTDDLARGDRDGAMSNIFVSISNENLENVVGGADGDKKDPLVSPETLGCAVGGAMLAAGGPVTGAVGCVAGAALTNSVNNLGEEKAARLLASGAFGPA